MQNNTIRQTAINSLTNADILDAYVQRGVDDFLRATDEVDPRNVNGRWAPKITGYPRDMTIRDIISQRLLTGGHVDYAHGYLSGPELVAYSNALSDEEMLRNYVRLEICKFFELPTH